MSSKARSFPPVAGLILTISIRKEVTPGACNSPENSCQALVSCPFTGGALVAEGGTKLFPVTGSTTRIWKRGGAQEVQ